MKYCYGISSLTQDCKHIFMCDIDRYIHSYPLERLIKYIQSKYYLSDMYIFKSTHGFNMLTLDKLPLKMVHNINKSITFCDTDFNKYSFKRGYYVLRIDKDKELINIIPHNGLDAWVKSNAHKKFLKEVMHLNIKPKGVFDDYTIMDLIEYPSKKDGYIDKQKQ